MTVAADSPTGPLERRAATLEAENRLDEAAAGYEAVLASNPYSRPAADGRARIALRRREPGAVSHCRRAVDLRERDPELQFQMISSIAVELGEETIPLVEDFVRRHPRSTAAQERLAGMRAEAGHGEDFAAAYDPAIRRFPDDKALRLSHAMCLARAGFAERALESAEAARGRFGDDPDFLILEAFVAVHEGLGDRAGALLDRLGDRPDALLVRGQYDLQTGRAEAARRHLETAVAADPGNLMIWAVLAVAWRLTGDPRHAWLCEQPGLCSSVDLGLGAGELARLADVLRGLHDARFHPVGQSLRGGTQTRGALLTRQEPEIAGLARAIAEGVRRHVAALPPADPRHPLLRHRDSTLSLGGSWSVRLADGGFHVAHVHPGGVISSACYIVLPESLGDGDSREGWLEIGRPPPELKVDLPPLRTEEPRQGKLVLFPSYLFHGTRPFGAGERLSVAFDVVARR